MAFADNTAGGRVIIDAGTPYPQTVTLVEACECGDALAYSSGWKRALSTTAASVLHARMIALEGGASADVIAVSMNPTIGGVTGGTAGSYVYVAEGTLYGEYTQTVPTSTGDGTTVIGIALDATTLAFFVNARADSTCAG